jgi:uncharacterized membrane protein
MGPAGAGIWLYWLLSLAVLIAIGALMVAIGIRLAGIGGRDDSGRLLRERFARGEITQAEYEEAKRILGL